MASWKLEVARLLLESGADKDLASNDGATALIMACYNGHLEVVRLLLESGTRKDLATNDGVTALFLASQNGHRICCWSRGLTRAWPRTMERQLL